MHAAIKYTHFNSVHRKVSLLEWYLALPSGEIMLKSMCAFVLLVTIVGKSVDNNNIVLARANLYYVGPSISRRF